MKFVRFCIRIASNCLGSQLTGSGQTCSAAVLRSGSIGWNRRGGQHQDTMRCSCLYPNDFKLGRLFLFSFFFPYFLEFFLFRNSSPLEFGAPALPNDFQHDFSRPPWEPSASSRRIGWSTVRWTWCWVRYLNGFQNVYGILCILCILLYYSNL